jgi:hypothetical protein
MYGSSALSQALVAAPPSADDYLIVSYQSSSAEPRLPLFMHSACLSSHSWAFGAHGLSSVLASNTLDYDIFYQQEAFGLCRMHAPQGQV